MDYETRIKLIKCRYPISKRMEIVGGFYAAPEGDKETKNIGSGLLDLGPGVSNIQVECEGTMKCTSSETSPLLTTH